MSNQEVIEKVKKLFALAGNNPSEKEAESAMLKAQELLLSHDLSIGDVDAFDEPAQKEVVEGALNSDGAKTVAGWKINISNAIARYFRVSIIKFNSYKPSTSGS